MIRIHWFRRDLRLHDNAALAAAAAKAQVLPIYILDADEPLGGAARWWLHHSLSALATSLGGLTILRGDPAVLLPKLAQDVHAEGVYWNRVCEPAALARDQTIKDALSRMGVKTQDFAANLLFEPWQIQTGAGTPFKVFTPFYKAIRTRNVAAPNPTVRPDSIRLRPGLAQEDPGSRPTETNWAKGWNTIWQPGEAVALARLDAFAAEGLAGYAKGRDFPTKPNGSRLSAHLHWGEISVRLLWHRISKAADTHHADDIETYLREVAWREFAYHLFYHAPDLAEKNGNRAFDAYPWRHDEVGFEAWKNGRTGYSFVDAGRRELWATGAMHNRVRMVAASFLTKHLRIHWSRGLAWFADTLVDADAAVNAASWQWVAGCGADAAPYFRIFNPTLQGKKFDPDGAYVRRWNPDAGRLVPIVDHAGARAAALDGYRRMKG